MTGGRTPTAGERAQAECWCGENIVWVSIGDLRDGWTRACRNARCETIGKTEARKRAGHGEVPPERP